MAQIEKRISEFGWKLLKQETIDGLHAGNIIRVSILDEFKKERKFIYKEFAANRHNEMDIYAKILPAIKSFVPVIAVWDDEPKAILMKDLVLSMKRDFEHLQYDNQKTALTNILNKLADLHTNKKVNVSTLKLPTHTTTTEWYDWCCLQLSKLHSLKLDWYELSWIELVEKGYSLLKLNHYEVKGPFVLTHGDPHLDNIFITDDASVFFIDWEWAALASPLRDITILLQDVYDFKLIDFVREKYHKVLVEKGLLIDKENYREDFRYLYFDHTLMMLAWEIEKFIQGYVSEEKIKKIIEFKLIQIKNVMKDQCY